MFQWFRFSSNMAWSRKPKRLIHFVGLIISEDASKTKVPFEVIGFSIPKNFLFFSSDETWTDDDFHLIFLSMLFYIPRISPHIFASHLKHTPAKKTIIGVDF